MSSQSYFFNPQDDRMSCAGSGLQLPRLSSTQRLALTVGMNDAGLQVFDITLLTLFIWTGAAWTSICGGGSILNGIGNPNGVVTATGPAIYFDNTDPTAPVQYIKSTSGTSNNEWV